MLRAFSGIEGEFEGERVARVSLHSGLWADFFWSRSLGVFHYFGAVKPPKMDPQHGAMLDLVLGSIFDRFWEVFLDVLGASWGHLGDVLGRLAAQVGAMLELVLGSIFDRFREVFFWRS